MKRFNSVEEIVKWLENHSDYGYYADIKYKDYFEKQRKNRMNCSDRVR